MKSLSVIIAAATALAFAPGAAGQEGRKFLPNYDEARVPAYTLPDPLMVTGAERITRADWEARGRPRTLELFRKHVYGRAPAKAPGGLRVTLAREDPAALGGIAIRREYHVAFTREEGPVVRLLVYLPAKAAGAVPAFLGLNFRGNQIVEADPEITMEDGYIIGRGETVKNNRATAASRGSGTGRWPARMIVARGYALATACCGNIDPDFHDGFANGVHALFPGDRNDESWGTIAAWAWGLSRLLDVLDESVPEIDAERVAVIGHSRLGKTALWAGAADERFAMVISNNSGCGGAALSRRAVGETVGKITATFPHWFCGNFRQYARNEGALPVDQHQLIALVAPRPVYVASATGDRWADPRGEFLSLLHAEPVFALYHEEPLGIREQPSPDEPAGNVMRYHLRSGKHDITEWDWKQYLAFGDRWLTPAP